MNLTATLRVENAVERSPSANLHVLTLTPFFPSQGDEASGCFIAENLKALETLGVSSTVVAVDPIYHRRRKASGDAPAQWIRYPQMPGNFGLASAGKFLGRTVLHKVRELHARRRIDVIHAHAALPCGHAAAILSRQFDIPFVVTIHGLDVFNRCFQDGLAAEWRKKASIGVYERADRVICISERVKQNLMEGSGAAISAEVVYNGTDAAFFAPGPPLDGPPTLLVVGTLLAGKGQELVLKAIARLEHEHPDLHCSFIGEGADQPRFFALAKQLGVENRIQFLGRRSRAEVAEAMRNCAIFVLPSQFEALGCVYLEAMASGKPAIGCYGQGIQEIIQDGINGVLIPADGLDELVAKLRNLLSSPELRARIGRAARQTIVDRLTLTHQAQALTKIYEQVAR
jgi:glycosyltransferase involved in cell wall biosynthesis